MIGAGASGFQIAPAIADDVEHLTVFQRTAQWMFPNPNYHEPSRAGACSGRCDTCRSTAAGTGSCCSGRAATRAGCGAGRLRTIPISSGRSARSTRSTRMMFTEWITSQVGDDPELAGQGGARLSGHRQAHAAGQRQLAADPDPRRRRTGPHADRPHRARCRRHRGWRPTPGRCHRVRHRLPRQQGACGR